MLDDISQRRVEGTGIGVAVAARMLSLFRAMTCSSHWASFQGRAEPVCAWRGFSCRLQIFCCWTSRPITWICGRRMCCWRRLRRFRARWFLFRTTDIYRSAGDARDRGRERGDHQLSRELRGLSAKEGGTGRPRRIPVLDLRVRHANSNPCLGIEKRGARFFAVAKRPDQSATGTTIVIEGGVDDSTLAAPPSGRSRRLNPIKQKQMEERCQFPRRGDSAG